MPTVKVSITITAVSENDCNLECFNIRECLEESWSLMRQSACLPSSTTPNICLMVARDTPAAYLPTSFHQKSHNYQFFGRWAFPTHFEGACSFLNQMLYTFKQVVYKNCVCESLFRTGAVVGVLSGLILLDCHTTTRNNTKAVCLTLESTVMVESFTAETNTF